MLSEILYSIGAAIGTFIIGVVVGRQTAANRQQVKELAAKLESANKERELAQASVEAAKAEITRKREQMDAYRGEVVEHFTGTSGLLRELTHQYRAVYDHLAQGASSLCPEGAVDFLEGVQPDELAAGGEAAAAAAATGEEPPRDDTAGEAAKASDAAVEGDKGA
jgi:uncharacterized membrane-anchored protein YhcB (DUF1043 family)